MSLSRSFSIYTLASLVSGAVPMLLLPVLTRHLSAADYGIATTMTTLVAFCAPLVMWGIHSLAGVEFHRTEPARFAVRFSARLRIPITTLGVLMAGMWLSRDWLAQWLQVPAPWIASAPLLAALSLCPLLQLNLLRMRNEPWLFGATELASTVITVSLTLWLVAGLHLTWTGRLYATAVAGAVMSVVALAWLRRNGYLVRVTQREAVSDALRFGAGVVPHELFNQVIRLADRLFIVTLVGQASAGQYAVATQVSSVMLVLLGAFNRAWSPYLFARLAQSTHESRVEIVKKSYMVIGGFFLFFLVFNAASPIFYKLLIDPKFHDSLPYVVWLTLGYFFNAIYLTYVDYIFYLKKTHILSMVTAFNMTCNLGLNYVLLQHFGTIGAAMAFAITMFLVMGLAFLICNRLHPMPWLLSIRRAAS